MTTDPLVRLSESQVGPTLAFLMERRLYGDSSWVGASSEAMVNQAILMADECDRWPSDQGDLGRCEETYRRAPGFLQKRMLPTLLRFRRHIEEGGLYCRGCDNSIGHSSIRDGLCDDCWEKAGKPEGGIQAVRIDSATFANLTFSADVTP